MPLTLMILAAALVLAEAPAPARAAPAQPTTTNPPAQAGAKPTALKKKKTRKSPRVPKSRRPAAADRAAADAHRITETAPRITAFPSESHAVDKAFAENRRGQIEDAERAARAAKQDDRWHTVLFHIRELDSRNDPEACFWRVLAYYRLGEVGRARTMRQTCDLPGKDNESLNAEDAAAAALQPTASLGEMRAAGALDTEVQPRGAAPVANEAPYTGARPTRFK
jgi:hypothetical protein